MSARIISLFFCLFFFFDSDALSHIWLLPSTQTRDWNGFIIASAQFVAWLLLLWIFPLNCGSTSYIFPFKLPLFEKELNRTLYFEVNNLAKKSSAWDLLYCFQVEQYIYILVLCIYIYTVTNTKANRVM